MDIVFFGPKGDYAGIYSTGSTERLKGLYKSGSPTAWLWFLINYILFYYR